MKIQEIVLNNIGPYLGENTITFNSDDATKNIALIGGRNGAGKTTLFDAMKICLYGYKLYGYRQNSQTYTSKIKKIINSSAKRSLTPKAGISISIYTEDGYSDNVFTISRDWGFIKNQMKETYHVYKNGNLLNDGELLDFDNYLLQTIPPALFSFHFFNGENVTEILFDKENGRSFRKAFMQICGLDTLDLIQEQLHNTIRSQSKYDGSSIQIDYYEKKAQFEQLDNQLSEILAKLKGTEEKITQLEEASALLEQQMTQYGMVHSPEWMHFQEQLKTEGVLREETHRYLRDSANNTLPFLILKKELAALQQQVRIEATLASNRAIRESLFKTETQKTLSDKLSSYLKGPSEQPDNAFFQTLYEAIRNDCPEDAHEFLKLSEREELSILSKIDDYLTFDEGNIITAEKQIKKSLAKTKRLRVKSEAKEIVSSEKYLSEKNEILTQIDSLRKRVIELTASKAELDNKLSVSRQDFEKISVKFKEALKERSVSDISAKALLAFDELRKNLYTQYVSQVEKSFVGNFNLLLSKDTLIDGIYISEDFEVIPYKNTKMSLRSISALLSEHGEAYAQEQLGERAFVQYISNGSQNGEIEVPLKVDWHFSAGEQQIYVMALYQALSEIRSSEIPFVIDTPLARIDSTHRKNILHHFFSKLPGQVIILSTDEEIDSASVKILQGKLSNLYLIESQEDGHTVICPNRYFKEVSN